MQLFEVERMRGPFVNDSLDVVAAGTEGPPQKSPRGEAHVPEELPPRAPLPLPGAVTQGHSEPVAQGCSDVKVQHTHSYVHGLLPAYPSRTRLYNEISD